MTVRYTTKGGKPLKKAPFLALVAVIVLLIGMWPPWPAGSQTTGITSQTQVVNSTAAAGTSSVIALDGKYSNCTVIAQTSTSTASVVVYGNTQATQYGPAAPNAVNSNFGSSGTITATTTQSQTSGNVANLPVGFYFTWSGNSGTLYAWAVCSSAIARAAAGATGAPGPTGPTGPPGPTGSPGAVPTFAANAPIAVATTATTVTYSFTGPLSVANGGTGTAAPAPTSSNGCTVTGTWPSQTFACPTAGAVALPSTSASPPIIVATPSGQVNISCPGCLNNNTACGAACGLLLVTGPAPTLNPTPQAGYAQVVGGFYVGPTGATPSPNPLAYQQSSTNCTTASMGNTTTLKDGITGDTAAFYCGGLLESVLNQNGVWAAGGYITPGNIELYQGSSSGGNCFIGPGINGWLITSSAGTCPLTLQSSATQNKGQLTCTLSTLACTQTATVLTGMTCVATLDTTATTATNGLFTVVSVAVSGSTLTITFSAIAGASGTVAADYHCL